ncbi:MAG: LEPR-XLL domain-containing protein, partial [Hyphomicrobiales bacterium]|nr:LEPR-XLL domain-containing protein [Hyphomicrobiales bacterium]
MRRWLRESTALSRRLHFETLEPRVLLSADLIPIQGEIEVPGEVDLYAFSLTEPKRVYFDSQTNTSNLKWTLTGPRGAEVTNRVFNESDAVDIGGNPVLDLVSGDYTLSIDGVGETTGDYTFRLLDLGNATPITPGTVVSGALDPGDETDLYQFDVTAGDRFYFDRLRLTANDPYWRLIDPYNNMVFGPSYFDDMGEFQLDQTGTYTLMIEGRRHHTATAEYAFNIQLISDDTGTMALDELVSGRIDHAGQKDHFDFTLAEDKRVIFDSLLRTSGLSWTLSGPQGTEVEGRGLQVSDSLDLGGNTVLDLVAGDYRLTIDGSGTAVESYAFRLLDFDSATAFTPGTEVSGSVVETDQAIGLVHGPSGVDLDGVTDHNALTLAGNNTYVQVDDAAALRPAAITVEAWAYRSSSNATYGTVLMKSSNAGWGDGYGLAEYDGNINFFVNSWSGVKVSAFLASGVWTHLAGTYDGSELKLYVNGELVDSLAYTGAINHSLSPLRIGSGAGNYPWTGAVDEVRVWNVARTQEQIAADLDQVLTGAETGLVGYWRFEEAGGTAVDDLAGGDNPGTLVNLPAVETKLYSFDGTAGDLFYFDDVAHGGGTVSYRLFEPTGRLILGPAGLADAETFALTATGTYVLAIEGRISNTTLATYAFNLQPVSNQTAALTLGAAVNGDIAHPGQTDSYTFTLAGDAMLAFDSFTADSSFNWTLTGPRGVEVASRGFQASDSWDAGSTPIMDLIAGDYTLTVDGAGDTTGAYGFRLLDLAAGTAVAKDASVTGSLAPGNETDVFRFDATAGDMVRFTRVSASGGSAYWRLIDPTGRLVFSQENFSTLSTTTLETTGTYTLLLEGRVNDANPLDYEFVIADQGHVDPPVLTGTPLTLGTTMNGAIDVAGEEDDFVFTLDAGRRLYFDSLLQGGNANTNLSWSLVGPRGTEIGHRWLYYSDAQELGNTNPVLDLPLAGTYRLRITGMHTIPYAFRILDLDDAAPLTPGTPVTGTLSPANATDLYRFDVTAGERFFFDQISSSNPNYYNGWRLFDPYGNQVWGVSDFADQDVLTLDRTGTYTLLFEGRVFAGSGTTDYTFNVQKVMDDTAALTLGDLVSGTIDHVGQQDHYTFTLNAVTQLYLDTLTDNANMSWTLTGPNGVSISRNLRNSDSHELGSTNPVMTLGAGDYTLTVDGSGATVGDYALRLSDLADGMAIGYGMPVDGVLSPANATNLYRLDATAGDRVFFNQMALSNATSWNSWRLIDPFGNQVLGPWSLNDIEGQTLEFTGTYTILVEGRIYAGSEDTTYTFQIDKVEDDTAAIVLDGPGQAGPLSAAGAIGTALTFTGNDYATVAEGAAVDLRDDVTIEFWMRADRFASTWMPIAYKGAGVSGSTRTFSVWLNNNGYVFLGTADGSGEQGISSASGSIQLNRWYHVAGVLDRTSGEMRLYIDGVEAASGALRTSQAVDTDTGLYLAHTLESNSGYGNFEGAIDDFRLWSAARSESDIANDKNTALTGAEAGLQLYLPMDEAAGAETLADSGPNAGNADVVNELAGLNGVVVGRFDMPGQVDSYTFTLAQDTLLTLDSLTDDSNVTVTIRGPEGLVVTRNLRNSESHEIGTTNPAFLAAAGDYTVTLDAGGDSVASYAFRVLDLGAAPTVDFGDLVQSGPGAANRTQAYRFDATAGDRVYLDALSYNLSAGYLTWRLIDPFGRQVFGPENFGDVEAQVLTYTGAYTLLLEGRNYANGTLAFSFKVHKSVDDSVALDLDGPGYLGPFGDAGVVGGAIAFTGGENVQVADPSLDLSDQVTVEFWINPDRYANTWTPLVYKGDGTGVGSRTYSVWLNDGGYIHLSSADAGGEQTISTANGTIPLNTWTHVAAVFDRTSGEMRVYLNGVEAKTGALRTGQSVGSDMPLYVGDWPEGDESVSPFEGRLDELRIWSTARGQAEIAAAMNSALAGNEAGLVLYLPMDETGQPTVLADLGPGGLTANAVSRFDGLAGVVTGRFDVPGEVDSYAFTLDQDALLYLDTLTDNSAITVTLTGPEGLSVSRILRNTDSGEFGSDNPAFWAPAGDYILTLDVGGAATYGYGLRVVDLLDGATIQYDEPQSGVFEAGNNTHVFRFDAQAGDQVFFDQVLFNASTSHAKWRLFDPFGQQVIVQTDFNDLGVQTMAFTGTYTVLLEPRVWKQVAEPYTFVLHQVIDGGTAITLDGVNPAPGPYWQPGRIDGGLQFTGVEYLEVAQDPTVDLAGDVTMEAWVKVDRYTETYTPLFFKGPSNDTNGRTYALYLHSNGRVGVDTVNRSATTASGAVALGEWTHIAGVIDRTNGTIKVYINGVEMASSSFSIAAGPSIDMPLYIGTDIDTFDDRQTFFGTLDEVRLWSVARTGEQIAAAMDQVLVGNEAGLALYLNLDETAGGTATDSSAKGNDAALVSYNPAGVTGHIDTPGQRDHYTFTLDQATLVYMDSLTRDSQLRWEITDGNGFTYGNRRFDLTDSNEISGNPVLSLGPGDYTVTIDADGDATPYYNFNLMDLGNAVEITSGTPVTDEHRPGLQTRMYRFAAEAGDRFYFDAQAFSGQAYWRLIDPVGNLVFNRTFMNTDVQDVTLALDGMYTLLAEGRIYAGNRNTYTFTVQHIVDDTVALALDTPVSGAIDHVGQRDHYTFTLATDARLYFDTLTNSSAFNWTLTGPRGTVVAARDFNDSDSYDVAGNPVLDLVAGDYTLTVDADNDTVGDYAFRLFDLA